MLKNRKLFSSSLVLIGLFLFGYSLTANASENESSVGVSITEAELYIESVDSPTFGVYKTSKESQIVQSKNDLVIKVVDKRESTGGWELRYSLSIFEQANGVTLGDSMNYSVGKGVLSGDETTLSTDIVEIGEMNQKVNSGDKIIAVKESKYSNYEYKVPNTGIKLNIPANPKIGNYTAVQTVTLESMPNYN